MHAAYRLALFSFLAFATLTALIWWRFSQMGDPWVGFSLALAMLAFGLVILNLQMDQARKSHQDFESMGLQLREELLRLKAESQALMSQWKSERVESEDTLLWMRNLSDSLLMIMKNEPKSTVFQANYDELKALRERLNKTLPIGDDAIKIQKLFEEIDETLLQYFERLYGSSSKLYHLIWDTRQKFSIELPPSKSVASVQNNVIPFRAMRSPFKGPVKGSSGSHD